MNKKGESNGKEQLTRCFYDSINEQRTLEAVYRALLAEEQIEQFRISAEFVTVLGR